MWDNAKPYELGQIESSIEVIIQQNLIEFHRFGHVQNLAKFGRVDPSRNVVELGKVNPGRIRPNRP